MIKIKKLFLDLLFPVSCLGCGRKDVWLCSACFDKIEINRGPCLVSHSTFLTEVWAASNYDQPNLSTVLHGFKYRFIRDLGEELGKILIKFLESQTRENLNFDLIVPIPLARRRELWRGFNQAEVLAEVLSRKFCWPVSTELVFRLNYHQPQVGLKAAQRQKNVKNVFRAGKTDLVRGKVILLIDDVVTTGATMDECAKSLKMAGAKQVFGLVVAKD